MPSSSPHFNDLELPAEHYSDHLSTTVKPLDNCEFVSLCSSRALIWTDFEEVLFAAERTRYRDVIWNADFVVRQLMSL